MTGLEGYYSIKNNKKMHYGYTTGSCAAGAAKAAASLLLLKREADTESLMTPKGILLSLPVSDRKKGEGWGPCALKTAAGYERDVTHALSF